MQVVCEELPSAWPLGCNSGRNRDKTGVGNCRKQREEQVTGKETAPCEAAGATARQGRPTARAEGRRRPRPTCRREQRPGCVYLGCNSRIAVRGGDKNITQHNKMVR